MHIASCIYIFACSISWLRFVHFDHSTAFHCLALSQCIHFPSKEYLGFFSDFFVTVNNTVVSKLVYAFYGHMKDFSSYTYLKWSHKDIMWHIHHQPYWISSDCSSNWDSHLHSHQQKRKGEITLCLPCALTVERQLSEYQGKSFHQNLTPQAPWVQTSSLQNCETINFCFLSHPVCGISWWQP